MSDLVLSNPPVYPYTKKPEFVTKDDIRQIIREELRVKGRVVEGGLMSVKEAAAFIGRATVYVYRHWKELGGRKIGKEIHFTKARLEKWYESKGR